MATHSNTVAWEIPWTEEPGEPWGRKESDTTKRQNNNKEVSGTQEEWSPLKNK